MTWEVGDLALCVRRVCTEATARTGIRQGGVYTVTAVVLALDGRTGLRLAGARNIRGRLRAVPATGFIKITPGTGVQGYEEPRRVPVKEDA